LAQNQHVLLEAQGGQIHFPQDQMLPGIHRVAAAQLLAKILTLMTPHLVNVQRDKLSLVVHANAWFVQVMMKEQKLRFAAAVPQAI
jgi:hypothetical protein